MLRPWQPLLAASVLWAASGAGGAGHDASAVTVDTSRFWLNYRHVADEAVIRQAWLDHGASGDGVLSLVADEAAADLASNPFPGQVLTGPWRTHDALSHPGPTDHAVRGADLTVRALLGAVAGRPSGPAGLRRRFPSSSRAGPLQGAPSLSHMVYLNGHGGDGFLKVQDSTLATGNDLAWAEAEFHARAEAEAGAGALGRSRVSGDGLLVLDTCQAASLWREQPIGAAEVWASSSTGRDSFAAPSDGVLGLSPSDAMIQGALAPLAASGRAVRRALAARAAGSPAGGATAPGDAAASASISTDGLRSHLTPASMTSRLLVRQRGTNADDVTGLETGTAGGEGWWWRALEPLVGAGDGSVSSWMDRGRADEAAQGPVPLTRMAMAEPRVRALPHGSPLSGARREPQGTRPAAAGGAGPEWAGGLPVNEGAGEESPGWVPTVARILLWDVVIAAGVVVLVL